MARVRQARRCRARRTNGEPCKAYAIIGGTVCRAHGGAAPQVRHAANVASVEAWAWRLFVSESQRLTERRVRWQTDRILTTSTALGIPPEQVDSWDIVACQVVHGVPALDDPEPTFATLPRDRRFRSPGPP